MGGGGWRSCTSAAVVVVMIVPVTLFLVFQRSYIEGSVGFISEK